MLSDTVGFVRDLPHHLVASFRATLEEAVHSDLLLIVLDITHPRAVQQLRTVTQVLNEIGATTQRRLLVLNKIDLLDHNADVLVLQREYPDLAQMSARTGLGMTELTEMVRRFMRGGLINAQLTLPVTDGKAIHFIESRANVCDRQYDGGNVVMTVRIGRRQLDQLRAVATVVRVIEEAAQEQEH
jgi:GTP-binding protein HflX